MDILTVERKTFSAYHIETILRTSEGQIKQINTNPLKQLKRGVKTIKIRGKEYQLNWEQVPQRKTK